MSCIIMMKNDIWMLYRRYLKILMSIIYYCAKNADKAYYCESCGN